MAGISTRIARLPVRLRPAYQAFLQQNMGAIDASILEGLLPLPSASFGVSGGVYDLQALLAMYPYLIRMISTGLPDPSKSNMVAAGRLAVSFPADPLREGFFQHLMSHDDRGDIVAACMAALGYATPEQHEAFQEAVHGLMNDAMSALTSRWSGGTRALRV